MPFKHPVSVLVVLHSPALEVLLIERARHPGFWQSVTGSVEPGEALAETARREVQEETGIVLAPGTLRDWDHHISFEIFPQWRDRYAPGVTHNTEHWFSAQIARDIPVCLAPEEHRAFRWLPWSEAAEACFSWSNRDAILQLPQRSGAL